jgi:predicted NAD/FAD-binding protein
VLKIAVIGSGISGLSCAWALSQRHDVTLIEAENRLGGHSNTVDVPKRGGGSLAVDTGFIVHNPGTYPNFVALLDYLDVGYEETEMSFSVSTGSHGLEYSGHSFGHLLGQTKQWISPTQWRLVYDLVRFYRSAEAAVPDEQQTLGEFLTGAGYSNAFIHGHILPIAAAIWSSSPADMANYPFQGFVRFFANHNLFALGKRPKWRTVTGGSRSYVDKLVADARFRSLIGVSVNSVSRANGEVVLAGSHGFCGRFDHVVLATHADQALRLLAPSSARESELLQHFKTSDNTAVLHRDQALMPRGRRFWSSWNYMGMTDGAVSVTYWMNELQKLHSSENHFVSLNPATEPAADKLDGTFIYRHPIFTSQTLAAQKQLWSLQGHQNTWFCGAWFGAGFHEDGLQAGLAVAEQLGGVRRPWNVAEESGRITITTPQTDFRRTLIPLAK